VPFLGSDLHVRINVYVIYDASENKLTIEAMITFYFIKNYRNRIDSCNSNALVVFGRQAYTVQISSGVSAAWEFPWLSSFSSDEWWVPWNKNDRLLPNTKCKSWSSSNIIRSCINSLVLNSNSFCPSSRYRSHIRALFVTFFLHYSYLTRTIILCRIPMLLYCWHIHLPA
jgi:hypothetical protein